MNIKNVQPGMVVVVRRWEDMENEYGYFDVDIIDTPSFYFTSLMKRYCGNAFIVTRIDEEQNLVKLKSESEQLNAVSSWNFSPEMFESYPPKEIDAPDNFDLSELNDFLNQYEM